MRDVHTLEEFNPHLVDLKPMEQGYVKWLHQW